MAGAADDDADEAAPVTTSVSSMPEDGSAASSRPRATPPGATRLLVTGSVLLGLLLGVPVWWATTAIDRAPLPLGAICRRAALVESGAYDLPRHLNVVLVPSSADDAAAAQRVNGPALAEAVQAAVERARGGHAKGRWVVHVSVANGDAGVDNIGLSTPCEALAALQELGNEGFDSWLAERLDAGHGDGGSGDPFTLVVLGAGGGCEEAATAAATAAVGSPAATVGQYGHAWVVTACGLTELEMAPAAAVDIVVGLLEYDGGVEVLPELPLAADGFAVLSFSLLNADPTDWVYHWDFDGIQEQYVEPLVAALAPVAPALAVESQELFCAPLGAPASWDAGAATYVIAAADLPLAGPGSPDWHLGAPVNADAAARVLHFAFYIPAAAECPLRVRLEDGSLSATNAFIVRGWGGITILSPSTCGGGGGGSGSGDASWPPAVVHLAAEDLALAMATALAHLRALLGLPPAGPAVGVAGVVALRARERGV
eukprot:SM001186S25542  [mRNA]  locus=s1186:1:1974:- [translate_table: standard]